ncbi:MAG: TauD/TfdA family dioxygenase [Crocosphaera sp.]
MSTLLEHPQTLLPSSTLSLPNNQRLHWQQDILSHNFYDFNNNHELLLTLAQDLAEKHLNQQSQETISLINQPNGLTHLHLKGFPQDPVLPITPLDGKRPHTKLTWVSEMVLLGIIRSALKYEPFSYLEQKQGDLVQNIVPIPGLEHTQSNASSDHFDWHSDDASLIRACRPEGIILSCLRNDQTTATLFASVDDIIAGMNPLDVEILRQPRFRVCTPHSFHLYGGKLLYSEPRPILSEGPSGTEIALATYNVQPVDPQDDEATLALWGLKGALRSPVSQSFILQPGELLIISNVCGLHARTPIAGDRWLQRTYFRRDLNKLRRLTSTHETCRVFSSEQLFLL